jgi:hypothetical protein
MACRITALSIDAHDPVTLAGFWCAVLGYRVVEVDGDGDVSIGPVGEAAGGPERPRVVWDFLHSTDPKRGKLPLHLDLTATDRDQAAELARLLELGARPADVGQGPDVSWHVLADPEGNEFCLLRGRAEP